MDDSGCRFVVVVPIKPPARGKSRLVQLPDAERIELARAFALDTAMAAQQVGSVVAVLALTDDFRLAAELAATGCVVMPDAVSDDLNANLTQAAFEVARRWPQAGVVALCADLPALRASELESALQAVPATGAAFVADASGTGTTLYAARRATDFAPTFGHLSANRHLDSGAVALDGDWPSLRQDVDEVGDLGRALVLGVGAHTRSVTGR
ncbi:2-phospho-L-lactate guanylyltransferase [Nocardioides sp.]|uniref:2-phospho-L-lactate guanylyltransferase n=1 Tax=Nocardioides sp. TaxID=35761 RepID=UPI003D0B81B7